MNTCKTCKFFKRGKYHKNIDPEESEQPGGRCELLYSVLIMSNSITEFKSDSLYVYENFGCILHKTD